MLRLVNLINAHRPGDDAFPITLEMAKWVRLLRAHLACEDEWFYPAMIASNDRKAASAARQFQADVGDLAEQLERFDRSWSSSAVIGSCFDCFRQDAFALFAAVDRRIAHEDRQLYPLAETSGIGAMPKAA